MRQTFYVIAAFLLGFLGFYKLSFVGTLGLNEILLLLMVPIWIVPLGQALRNRELRVVVALGVLYLGSQMLSDWYRQTPSEDYLRGWAKISITLTSILVFSLILQQTSRAVVAFVVGSAFATVANLLFYGTQFGAENVYKFYLGVPISIAAFLAVCYAPQELKKAAGAVPFLAGILAFVQDARAQAGLTILGHFANMFSDWRTRQVGGRSSTLNLSLRSVLVAGLSFAVVGYGIFAGYRVAASNGWLGAAAETKYIEQSTFRGTGEFTIFSGRTEIFFAVPKIVDSPLLGWGSWAKDLVFVFDRAQELGMNAESVSIYTDPTQAGLIPTHSHVFGGWLEAGLLGGIFWLVVLWKSARVLLSDVVSVSGKIAPLMRYLLIAFVWDLVFSPYGAERRVWNGFMIAWLVSMEIQLRLNLQSQHGPADWVRYHLGTRLLPAHGPRMGGRR